MTDFTTAAGQPEHQRQDRLDWVPVILGINTFERQFEPQTRLVRGESMTVDHDLVVDIEVDELPELRAASLALWVGNEAVSNSTKSPAANILRYVESDPSRLERGAPLTLRWELEPGLPPPRPADDAPRFPDR